MHNKPKLLDAAGVGSTQVPGKGKAIFGKLDHNLQLLMLTQIFL